MTLAAITMTAPEAASPVQMYRATYSPDDNKLRLYAVSRLDPETYKKVHDAGFRWAPKQALFVAPAWTPGREDVLLSLAGEIEDEDSTLAERQEARAERFTGYSGKRASESAQALDEVERLAAMIPPGQPILVGHHSERRARRDAQRIENGMKRAVMLFERAEYWEERARSALLHAKYKERPDVRWRRIKKIEADLRKAEKTIAQSQKYLTMWRAESLDLNMAKLISSHDHISACFPLDTYPRPAEKSQYEGSRSLWSALDDDIITTEQAREIAIRCHERQIQHQQRWVNHYQNRLIYERAMLDESGGVVTRTQDFEPGGQVFSRGEWLTIIRVNKSNGAVSSVTTPNYSFLGQASIAISNTSPNLFTVPGDRIIAVNSLDGALTNNEQTASGGVVVPVSAGKTPTAATANWWTHCFPSKSKNCVPSCVIHRRPTWWKRKLRKRRFPSVLC